jgi:hypothetical protein
VQINRAHQIPEAQFSVRALGWDRPISEATSRHVHEFQQSKDIWHLRLSNVDRASLQILTDLQALETLYLTGKRLTDDAVSELKKLSGLKFLSLNETYMSYEAVADLRRALPDCTIESGKSFLYPPNDTPWSGDDHLKWQILDPIEFKSEGGASISKLADKSLLVSGKEPEADTYIIRAETTFKTIAGLRIEVLQHESLPWSGPGRAGNFVLNEVTVETAPLRNPKRSSTIAVQAATADFSQPGFNVDSLTRKPALGTPDIEGWMTGWAIGGSSASHICVLSLAPSPTNDAGNSVTVRLIHARPRRSPGFCVGRFRLSISDGARPPATKVDGK